jgi:hypothetical protein
MGPSRFHDVAFAALPGESARPLSSDVIRNPSEPEVKHLFEDPAMDLCAGRLGFGARRARRELRDSQAGMEVEAMTGLATLALAISVASPGGIFFNRQGGNRVMPPGPGYGWGFPNGNPDGYGWVDYGDRLPLGADRTCDYFFRRYDALPPEQLMMPTYFNPYLTRGQRYIMYSGCGGGVHPMSGAPLGSSVTPAHPYQDAVNRTPLVAPPLYRGRSEAPAVPSGGSGLIP